ncbi:selenoprotein domain-containing protein [Metarhizium acridum CQMa 102]|uniref:Selenoprotein domain-containing protein n=1 Tax=Metarhizium acridum (strain CQMa 102) TaxID=655827 RepID=E9EFL2_METAQ|nr:selenoprotein domain-containing protein [Metarhizium acridum CQMa 102]EFY85304.1 selenoprotein domain-containing protein [Metarhizium acridum CQMa 102]
MAEPTSAPACADYETRFPRVTIQFCTQCKWMLRAAYFAQELLSTFSTSLGEVSLQPSTGGAFVVTIHHQPQDQAAPAVSTVLWDRKADGGVPETKELKRRPQDQAARAVSTVLWDRKADGGFPETKELKRRVRDVIEPGRDLGHVDRHHSAHSAGRTAGESSDGAGGGAAAAAAAAGGAMTDTPCEDCK